MALEPPPSVITKFNDKWIRWIFQLYKHVAVIEDWQSPTFENSWVNFGSLYKDAAYYKDPFGVVHLQGFIKDGTIGATAFTLPIGYRPEGRTVFVSISGGNTIGRLDIFADGSVDPLIGSNIFFTLDGISFRTQT